MNKIIAICIIYIVSVSLYGQKYNNYKLYHHAIIYTVDSNFSTANAMVVNERGRIAAIGEYELLRREYTNAVQVDMQGKYIYPGFIDAHCHYFGLGVSKQIVDLRGTKNIQEVIDRCLNYYKKDPSIQYIIGRGWDQNDWEDKQFPDHTLLSQAFPKIPVILKRIDGHAAWINQHCINTCKITSKTKVDGGEIIIKNQKPTGILIDNAVDLVMNIIPPMRRKEILEAMSIAQAISIENGLTSVVDAGLEFDTLMQMAVYSKILDAVDVYGMYSTSKKCIDSIQANHIINQNHVQVKGVKIYIDGALGSRGAALLEPYNDRPESKGLILMNPIEIEKIAQICYEKNLQLNAHCIGDSAVKLMLHIMAKVLKGPNDRRWRIEHCQVIDPNDLAVFKRYHIIPSVQPTHATSDMYWAEKRLGSKRIKNAYSYKELLQATHIIALGTDFPVEEVNPFYTFTSAVWRMDTTGFPNGGFQMENALDRESTLKGMTIWAAYSVFAEKEIGSLEPNKKADFIVLDIDLMKENYQNIYHAQVISTYKNGIKVYHRQN